LAITLQVFDPTMPHISMRLKQHLSFNKVWFWSSGLAASLLRTHNQALVHSPDGTNFNATNKIIYGQ
jgi:hypothetical protein